MKKRALILLGIISLGVLIFQGDAIIRTREPAIQEEIGIEFNMSIVEVEGVDMSPTERRKFIVPFLKAKNDKLIDQSCNKHGITTYIFYKKCQQKDS